MPSEKRNVNKITMIMRKALTNTVGAFFEKKYIKDIYICM